MVGVDHRLKGWMKLDIHSVSFKIKTVLYITVSVT